MTVADAIEILDDHPELEPYVALGELDPALWPETPYCEGGDLSDWAAACVAIAQRREARRAADTPDPNETPDETPREPTENLLNRRPITVRDYATFKSKFFALCSRCGDKIRAGQNFAYCSKMVRGKRSMCIPCFATFSAPPPTEEEILRSRVQPGD